MDAFDGVIGQEHAIAALRHHLARGGGAGSTLLVGPEGVGRFLLAHRTARAILGDETLVESFHHPDLAVLEPRAGINGVRAAAAALQRRPAQGPRQVLLIRDADRFGIEAHNALLKTLEEPPGGAAILLTATDENLLPDTVVSRCRLVRTRALTDEETAAVLEEKGLPEKGAVDAEGSPGRAVYHEEKGILAQADRLEALLGKRAEDPLAETEKLVRKRKEEETADQRRRLVEVCRVVAGRLRRGLPETELRLRRVTEALGSLAANANPAIVFADLALLPWKKSR